MEALLVGLLLALVSGVTFVAYKHSFSYRRIIRTLVPPFPQFLLVVSLILFTLLVTLYQGALGLHNALDESLEAPVSTLASAINSHYNLATIYFWGFIIFNVVVLYLTLLYHLPKILNIDSNDGEEV